MLKFILIVLILQKGMSYMYGIKTYNRLIINLDDLVDYHYSKDLVDLMTRISPIIQKYKKNEFVITNQKLDEIFTYKNCGLKLELTDNDTIYHEHAIKQLKHLGDKTNSQFSIIYSKNSKIAIDYYISKIATLNNNMKDKTQVVKNCGISQLKAYWDLATPIKILKLKKNNISFSSISTITNLDTNIPYISDIVKFIE